MLKRFSATNYRNVAAKNLEFRRVTALVGPNNGGKSNLLDALNFYGDVVMDERDGSGLLMAIERRGYGEILQRSLNPPQEIELRWELEVGAHRQVVLDIAFRVGPSGTFPAGFYVTRDNYLVTDPTSDRLDSWTIDEVTGKYRGDWIASVNGQKETAEADAIPSDLRAGGNYAPIFARRAKEGKSEYPSLGNPVWLSSVLKRQGYYVGSRLEPRQIAASVKRDLTAHTLDETGSQLVNVANNLERRHNDFLDPYTARLSEMLTGLDRIRLDDVSDQYKSMKLRIDGQWFRLDEVSEGTLKAMVLALLLYTPEKVPLLAIDEPELNLHPAWLRVLGNWILRAEGAEQVIISTHSPDLLDTLTEGFRSGEVALIICDQKKGFHNVEAAALDTFWKDGWELGDLYRVGEPQLGGWPW